MPPTMLPVLALERESTVVGTLGSFEVLSVGELVGSQVGDAGIVVGFISVVANGIPIVIMLIIELVVALSAAGMNDPAVGSLAA